MRSERTSAGANRCRPRSSSRSWVCPLDDLDDFLHFKNLTLGQRVRDAAVRRGDGPREEAVVWIQDYFNHLLDDRLGAGRAGDDLLGWLITTEVDGERLPREDLLDILGLLMIAGLDTVAASLACFLSYLARHPDDRAALVADPSRWPSAIEELHALSSHQSPTVAASRSPTSTCRAASTSRPGPTWASRGTRPTSTPSTSRIRSTVDFDRSPNPHIGFASGFHRCLGSHLARMEMRVALEAWHRRIPDYEIKAGLGSQLQRQPPSASPPDVRVVIGVVRPARPRAS